ncbi:hypothetical protein B0T16DRAFT_287959, partial [Cercophora newfieldiana]
MRRRHSVKPKSNLGRRMSNSSVHSVRLEHIDPALAERDAHIAALEAYARARNRTAADMPLFPPTPDSSPRHRQANRDAPAQDASSDGLRRRQSVRFVGPFSVQGRTGPAGGVSAKHTSGDTGEDSAKAQDGDDSGSSHSSVLGLEEVIAPALPTRRPPRRPQRDPPSIPLPSISTRYIDALAAEDEYYTPEDDIASMPSSYRRLRRSRSMFTEEHRTRRSQDNSVGAACRPSPSSTSRRVLHPLSRGDASSPRAAPLLRAPKSMSFLRNRRLLPASRASRESNRYHLDLDDPVSYENTDYKTLATAQSTPQLGVKTSSMFGSRNRRMDPPMRKSLRSGSTADHIDGENPGAPLGRDDGFKTRARKASKSLKTKLRSLFSLSRSEDATPTIPAQHIESQRTHASEDFGSVLGSEIAQPHAADWGSFHRVPSGLPSIQTVPSNIIHSNKGSLESLRSEQERKVSDDRSLTSWANSGPSTLTSQQQQQWREWEAQRLSIIRENGTHAPSSSMRRPVIGTQLFQNHDHDLGNPVASGTATDSQRIYSALMKRIQAIQDRNEDIIEQRQRNFVFKDSNQDCATPSRLPSFEVSCGTPKATETRIFRANGLPSHDPAATPTRASKPTGHRDHQDGRNGWFADQSSAALEKWEAFAGDGPMGDKISGGRTSALGNGLDAKMGSQAPSPDPFTSGPAERTAATEDLKAFSDRGSAFFGSPTSYLFRTTSPYRRALKKSMEEETLKRKEGMSSQQVSSEGGTQIHVASDGAVPTNNVPYTDDQDYTESIYSTDEHGIAEIEETRGQVLSAQDSGAPEDSLPTYQPVGCRVDSSSSSVDWKTWLSANIAKLESSPPSFSRPSGVEFALPTMPKCFAGGHVRESAQTHEDYEEELKTPEPPTRKPTLPTSPLATVEPNVVKPSPQQRSLKRATPPANRMSLHENDVPSGVPPIPPKSVLRSAPSPLRRAGPNIGYSVTPSISSSPGLSAAVQKQFGPVS